MKILRSKIQIVSLLTILLINYFVTNSLAQNSEIISQTTLEPSKINNQTSQSEPPVEKKNKVTSEIKDNNDPTKKINEGNVISDKNTDAES